MMGAVTPETCRVVLQWINICILLHLLDFYSHYIISHYFHTLHQLNQTALCKWSPFETLLGLLWNALFCSQCLKWLCWFLSLCHAYYPQQHKQRDCSNAFIIWPMKSSYSYFWLPLGKHPLIFCNDLQFKLLTRRAHSMFTSSLINIPSMSTAKQDTVVSSWDDHFKTLWTYERLQQQWGAELTS